MNDGEDDDATGMNLNNDEDDNDLADLLGNGPSSNGSTRTPALTSPASGRYAKHQERVYQTYYQKQSSMSCCDYVSAYISV
jgi:hypothetical protein